MAWQGRNSSGCGRQETVSLPPYPFHFIQGANLVGVTHTQNLGSSLFSKSITNIKNYAEPISGLTQYYTPMTHSLQTPHPCALRLWAGGLRYIVQRSDSKTFPIQTFNAL